MIKVIFFDAGGVLLLNENGHAVINKAVVEYAVKHSQFTFGILSSTDLPLREIIKSYGLETTFALTQTSASSGFEKDDPAYFTYAVGQLNVSSNEAILVDNDEDFIRAADQAGLKTVLYTPELDLESVISSIEV